MTNQTNTALQVINFNFYGDDLIALKDNATGEIYISINSVLRGIGFTTKGKCLKRWRSAFPCNSCYTDENHITKGVKPEWEMENRNQPLHSQRYPVL